jgi:hypothetical protein
MTSDIKRRTPLKRGPAPKRKTPLPRSTWRPKPKPRSAPKRYRSPNEFPETVKAAIRRRSGNMCEFRSSVCTGKATVFHHRKRRESGDNREVNGLHGCDSCHKYAHAHPVMARLMGWIVYSTLDPADVPVRPGAGG